MIWLILAELLFLFLLSRALTQALYRFVFLITTSSTVGITILSLLFFPGTVVHELSHWIVAEVVRVRTGEMTLYPVVDEGGVRLGSVEIARSDPFRRLIVGLAPIMVGIVILMASYQFYAQYFLEGFTGILRLPSGQVSGIIGQPLFYLYLYVLFSVGNNMFSSKRDLEGFIVVSIVLVLLGLSTYLAGLWPQIPSAIIEKVQGGIGLLFAPLTLVVSIDFILLVALRLGIEVMQKVLKRRIIAS